MNFAEWNQCLLASAVFVAIGGMLLVSASSLRERLIAVGTLAQAILLALVANGSFHRRDELVLAAIAVMIMFALWCLLAVNGEGGDQTPVDRSNSMEKQ